MGKTKKPAGKKPKGGMQMPGMGGKKGC